MDEPHVRTLIFWRPDSGIDAIVEIFHVHAPEDPKDYFEWLDKARDAANAAGFSLYNWGSVEPISREEVMKRIASYNKENS